MRGLAPGTFKTGGSSGQKREKQSPKDIMSTAIARDGLEKVCQDIMDDKYIRGNTPYDEVIGTQDAYAAKSLECMEKCSSKQMTCDVKIQKLADDLMGLKSKTKEKLYEGAGNTFQQARDIEKMIKEIQKGISAAKKLIKNRCSTEVSLIKSLTGAKKPALSVETKAQCDSLTASVDAFDAMLERHKPYLERQRYAGNDANGRSVRAMSYMYQLLAEYLKNSWDDLNKRVNAFAK